MRSRRRWRRELASVLGAGRVRLLVGPCADALGTDERSSHAAVFPVLGARLAALGVRRRGGSEFTQRLGKGRFG
jgi:hypothetical protein